MRSRAALIAAVATSIIATAAVPAHLAAAGMWTPQLPSLAAARQWIHQPLTTDFVIALAQAGAVMLWLLLATAVLTRAYRRLARTFHWLPALHLPGPVKGLTAALLGATAVTTTAAAPAQAVSAAGAAHDTAQPAAGPSAAVLPTRQVTSSQDLTVVGGGRTYTHTVKRGDTLSEIAAQWLGDADRWPEIFALNRGTHFTHAGGTLRNPNVIYPGWTLTLPDDATPPAAHQPPPAPPPPAGDEPDVDAPAPAPTTDPPSPAPAPATPEPTATTPTSAEPTPTATPTTGGTCAPTSSDSTGDTAAPGPTGDRSPRAAEPAHGVWLPSGSWIDLGLALAISAAVALVWAHRQRRYTPGRPSNLPGRGDATLAPMPRVVGQIRRALRHTAVVHPDAGQHDEHDGADAPVADGDDVDAASTASGIRSLDDSQRETSRGVLASVPHRAAPTITTQSSGTRGPLVPALAHPLSVMWPPAGLGLTGPAAHAAARGFLTAALAADADAHPDARTQVVMPSATAAALLGSAVTLPRSPRLRITAGLNEALDILEALTLHRTRLIDQHEAATVADLRADAYEEPLPPVMLLAEAAGRHEHARIAALLTQGQRLDIHGVLLGAWPDGNTVIVDDDGTTTPADGDTPRHDAHPADVDQLSVLNPTETLDLLATLAEAHTGEASLPAPAEPASTQGPDTAPAQPVGPAPVERTTRAGMPAADTPAFPDDSRAQGSDGPPADVDEAHIATGAPATGATPPLATDPAAGSPGPVRVRVFGAPGIADSDPQRTLRAKSLELLVYLAVRDGSAPTEAILDDLLPDAPARKAVHRLHTYVSDLRSVLRHRAGPGTYLTHPHHHYQLNPDRLDIDLWRMRAAIRAANAATAKPERVAALRRAVGTYRAPLAEGCAYEWLEPYREAVRQEALNAAVALTEELDGQPSEQLAVLDEAIAYHPYAEQLYQAAMRARAQLGDADGVRVLRRTVTRQLGEIDAEPSDETLTLADRLIADLPRSSRSRRPSAANGALS